MDDKSDEIASCEVSHAASTSDPHSAAIEKDMRHWWNLSGSEREALLKEIENGRRTVTHESMVQISRRAYEMKDERTVRLAYRALSQSAIPLLKAVTRRSSPDDRNEDMQDILAALFQAIVDGKSALAELKFAAFARRRAIDCHRRRHATFEGKNRRKEPFVAPENNDDGSRGEHDVEGSLEQSEFERIDGRALMSKALDSLAPEWRAALIQYHRIGLSQAEIATHHGVSERTIRNWLKSAYKQLGISGEEL